MAAGMDVDTVLGDSLIGELPAQHVSRALAAALAVTLGPFGAHRIYLGTTPKVPLLYGLTFGGFGVLVLIDLGHILFTKDLSRFQENDRIFMWAGSGEAGVIPP
jgi:TM2 domain-containing membrane protein YozV